MTTPWLKVDAALLKAALADLDNFTDGFTIDVPPTLLQGIVELLSEDLGCDHSVGICMCDTVGIVQELNLALEGKRTCPTCAGDGMVWDQAKADAFIEQNPGISDCFAGYTDCPNCGRSGSVTI